MPKGLEIEKKYLIKYPDVSLLKERGAVKKQIKQVYLSAAEGVSERVRRTETEEGIITTNHIRGKQWLVISCVVIFPEPKTLYQISPYAGYVCVKIGGTILPLLVVRWHPLQKGLAIEFFQFRPKKKEEYFQGRYSLLPINDLILIILVEGDDRPQKILDLAVYRFLFVLFVKLDYVGPQLPDRIGFPTVRTLIHWDRVTDLLKDGLDFFFTGNKLIFIRHNDNSPLSVFSDREEQESYDRATPQTAFE